MKRGLALAGCLLLVAGALPGHYGYVQFNSRTAPWTPISQKFDLAAIPNRTVSYFISEQAPAQLAPNDSLTALISQIRAAAAVWDEVQTSDLRIAFGGLIAAGTPQSGPAIDVLFDEVPPGIVAMGGPTVTADSNGSFVPIQRSVVRLNRDLSQRPSYSESFFGTLVHEFGHALGLQHSLTSGAMATGITRATSKARPLAADDIAGISTLYPARAFSAATGAITGRVTLSGQGVNLASVVAIAPNGPAVSALTNPDGTYRIEGMTPGQYLVYAHPLPPALTSQGELTPANITYPVDADRRPLAPGGPFETQFYPNTRDPQQAFPIAVVAGVSNDGVNFQVRTRGPLQLHSVQTYGFPGNVTIKPPYLNPGIARPFLVASGNGLVANNNPAPGLSVAMLSGASLGLRSYTVDARFAQMDVDLRSFTFGNDGPRHLIFSLNNDIYVLPAGFYQSQNQPPAIASVTPASEAGARVAVLAGSNLSAETRVWFDGAPAEIRGYDEASGRLTVVPPPAPAGHRAAVAALNADGQSSLFLQAEPHFYPYEGGEAIAAAAGAILTPGSLPAGVETTIQIDGADFDSRTTIGFGSSDIQVRRLWVLSPTRLIANVTVARGAAPGAVTMTIATGLRINSQPFALTIQAGGSSVFSLGSQVLNALGAGRGLWPGSTAVLTVVSAPAPLASTSLSLTMSERPVQILSVSGNQISFVIPPATALGPAVLRLQAGAELSLPIAVAIEAAPPQISAVLAGNTPVDALRPARAGDLVILQVSGLAEPGTQLSASRVTVNVAGAEYPAQQVLAQQNLHLVFVFLPAGVSGGTTPITVSVDGRTSAVFHLNIRP